MRIYRESLKNICTAIVILSLVVAFFLYFRTTLLEILEVSWNLSVGEAKAVCTPQDRLRYLQKHKKQIKLAMIGNWAMGKRTGRPRQNVLGIAIQRINQAGGINGREIVPEWMDTNDSTDKLHEFVEKIAHDPSYYAIIGPSTSGQLLSVKPLLLTYKLLTIAPAVSNTNATLPGDPPYIFLPNSSDAQDVLALRNWAEAGQRDKFILISENQPFSMGYSAHVERLFFESDMTISARTFFNPSDNIRYFLEELKNYADFFNIQNALIINYSAGKDSYERLAKWMLAHTKGDVFTYKILNGHFTDDELKRLYSIVYSTRDNKMKFFIEVFSHLPEAVFDAFSPAAYRSLFLFAAACQQSKSMLQDDVIDVMCKEALKTPYEEFRFNESRFEANPKIRVVSVYQLHQDWGYVLMQGQKKNEPKKKP